MPRMILLDLDGTLVDSVPDLTFCIDGMLETLGRAPAGEANVRLWVGNGVEWLVKRALTGELWAEPEAGLLERAMPHFRALYAENNAVRSRLYPGVRPGLDALRNAGYLLGLVTNKPEAFTHPLLRTLGLDGYFGVVVGGDTLPQRKPDPAPLLYAARRLGTDPEHALMVGDSEHDVQAARSAGFGVVCVSYGYNHGRDIRTAKPDAVVDSLQELPALLGRAA